MRIRFVLALCAVAAALVCGLLGRSAPARAAGPCDAWMNTSKTPAQRAQALLAAMTNDDKIKLTYQNDTIWTYYGVAGHVGPNAALCIPDLVLNDAGQGVGDQMQLSTAYPSPIAQTASWDRVAQTRMGERLGWEAWHKGVNVQLAPGMDITRVPRNGRNWEYMGEDPYLSGQTAAAWIEGLQSQHVVATMKHYVLNDQEQNRMSEVSQVDSRTMQEIYLPGWENAVKEAHVGSTMCSYNKAQIDGGLADWVCQHPTLLTTYLKQEMGFDGWVMSDWGGKHDTVKSANAGMDQDMNLTAETTFASELKTAVETTHTVPQSRLDDMAYRILYTMFRVGLFDYPTPAQPGAAASNTQTPESLDVARDTSEAGTVLLKNQNGLLPLTGTMKRIALIGDAAGPNGASLVYNGGGSGHIPEVGYKSEPGELVSPLTAMQQRALFANDTVTYTEGTVIQDAVVAATAADYAIVWAHDAASEGVDRPSLDLDHNGGVCTLVGCQNQETMQNELISAVTAAQPNTIVVLNTAGPVIMPWLAQVKAVVEAWYPGQQDGNAIAPILFGDVNPSGHLAQTFPNNDNELPKPSGAANVPYTEGLLVGYRWYDANSVTPLFCFGHGLSYTTFGYSGLSVTPGPGNTATVSFTVTNTGSRAGREVAQVYVGLPAAAGEPPKQLKGYQKVFVPFGGSAPVTIALDSRSFSYWNTASGWTVIPGTYHISVGSSSCDIRLQGDVSFAPTAVTLRTFTAQRAGPRDVVLRWRTGMEADLLGFDIYGRGIRLNPRVIPARHRAGGASYVYRVHHRAAAGEYALEAVRLDGSRVRLASAHLNRR
jgi:beta-glucosidase